MNSQEFFFSYSAYFPCPSVHENIFDSLPILHKNITLRILSEGRRFPVTEGIGSWSVLSLISILLISNRDCGVTLVHKFISAYGFCLIWVVVSGWYACITEWISEFTSLTLYWGGVVWVIGISIYPMIPRGNVAGISFEL